MQLNYKCHWHQRVATSATADNISQDKLVRCWFYISRKLLCCACCNRGYLNFFLHQNLLVNKFSPYAVLVPPSLDDPLHVLYCDPGFFLLLVSKIERPEEMIVITIHVSATLCTRAFPVGSPSTKWRSVLRYTWFDIFCEIVSYKKVWYLTSCCKVVIMMKQYDWMAPHISHEELCDIFHLHDFPACYPLRRELYRRQFTQEKAAFIDPSGTWVFCINAVSIAWCHCFCKCLCFYVHRINSTQYAHIWHLYNVQLIRWQYVSSGRGQQVCRWRLLSPYGS